MDIHRQFAQNVVEILKNDSNVIGLTVAGSWFTNELDEFSDLDLILVTIERITNDKAKMLTYARSFGDFLPGFTGEHVGEPRLLICLFDNPLLHVDIKFLTLEEFQHRVETPIILLDKEGQLNKVMNETEAKFPYPDYQWIEDRFWTWIHYALLKIGRGEYMEAYDFFAFFRMTVFGPLFHIKNHNLPRGVRRVETLLPIIDLMKLKSTMPDYSKISLLNALENSVELYRELRKDLFNSDVKLQSSAEERVIEYLEKIKSSF